MLVTLAAAVLRRLVEAVASALAVGIRRKWVVRPRAPQAAHLVQGATARSFWRRATPRGPRLLLELRAEARAARMSTGWVSYGRLVAGPLLGLQAAAKVAQ